ncbi:MAG: M48 family metallopeptidase [Bacteroidetes bacterium]|nr:M48 family metallopeptidase [Bacteroidota bacterium]
MAERVQVGEIAVDVVRKDVRRVHLSVHPPTGAVRIAAPVRMSLETIRAFAVARLPWIRLQRRRLGAQERETPRDFLFRESHYLWGRRYLLRIVESGAPPGVQEEHSTLVLNVRPGAGREQREDVMETWYRGLLRAAVLEVIARREPQMGVRVERLYVQRMKTRWGSCNPAARSIRLNTELARKPLECLEYIVVHEMAHLLEPRHNARFTALMDLYLPTWRRAREALNRLPVRHETWGY